MKTGIKITNDICKKLYIQGKSQKELAFNVRVKREYMNRIINSKITPTVGLAIKIANALCCPVEEIFHIKND